MAGPASSLEAAILTVSTTAATEPGTDGSGPALRDALEQEEHSCWRVREVRIVADDVDQIRQQITRWTDSTDPPPPSLILTTGGTGFAVGDVTPEAVSPLLHKQAPGLVQAIMAASMEITPFAMVSRPVAGVRNKSVIVTLAGSPKAALENLGAIVKVLPHGCRLASGANSRALHAGGTRKLEAEAGIVVARSGATSAVAAKEAAAAAVGFEGGTGSPHDHDGHGKPARHAGEEQGPARRHRSSPYPMVSVEAALGLVQRHLAAAEVVEARVDSSLVGAILAENVVAREHVPAFRASIVDGYALVAPLGGGSLRGVYPVVSVSQARAGAGPGVGPGAGPATTLKQGQLVRITTGAPLPPGADCVVMVEDTVLKLATEDGQEEREVEIVAEHDRRVSNIRAAGSDIAMGTTILAKHERITSTGGEIGLLAAVGRSTVLVYRRPVVAVVSTGDELVRHDRPGELQAGEVRDTNRPALLSIIRGWGYEAVDGGIVADEPGRLEAMLRLALRQADVVVTTGGASMGELDLLKPTIERALGGTIHFGRVAMKPGKPTTFATVPVTTSAGTRTTKAVFSLPGNPASALVTCHLFVLAALHQLSGLPAAAVGLPRVPVVLADTVALDPRPEFHRAVVSVGRDGRLEAHSTGGQRSSRVGSLRSANALLCLPGGKGVLRRGERAEAMLIGPLLSGWVEVWKQ